MMIAPGAVAADYAAHIPPAEIAKAGVKVVCRYIGGGAWKQLTPAERDGLWANGVGILLNWEAGAADPLKGAAIGKSHGEAAKRAAIALGYPLALPIIVSVDTDFVPKQHSAVIQAYFREFKQASGWSLWAYGEADVIDFLFGLGLISGGWQTVAWSGGRISRNAYMLQKTGTTFHPELSHFGTRVDHNEVLKPVLAWGPPIPEPPVVEPPVQVPVEEDVTKLIQPFDGLAPDSAVFVVHGPFARWVGNRDGRDGVAIMKATGAETEPGGNPHPVKRIELSTYFLVGDAPQYPEGYAGPRTSRADFLDS